jgi:ABC-type oligopeptide transport system substrate-binding subunit
MSVFVLREELLEMKKQLFLLITLIVALTLVAACSGASAPAEEVAPAEVAAPVEEAAPAEEVEESAPSPPAEPKAMAIQRDANDPRSIDPQQAIDTRDWNLLAQLFPSLTELDTETHEVVPGAAESWDISDDGLVYTFHLIEGLPWVRYNPDSGVVEQVQDENGNARVVTAHDFVYGYLRALDPATGSPAAYMLSPYIAGATEFNSGEGRPEDVAIEALDDYTLQVTSPEKVGFTLAIFGLINARATPGQRPGNAPMGHRGRRRGLDRTRNHQHVWSFYP